MTKKSADLLKKEKIATLRREIRFCRDQFSIANLSSYGLERFQKLSWELKQLCQGQKKGTKTA